jgi:hypothetical protein
MVKFTVPLMVRLFFSEIPIMRKSTLCELTFLGLGLFWAGDRVADGCAMVRSRIVPLRVDITDGSAINWRVTVSTRQV